MTGARAGFFKICGVSRHHHPLNPLSPLNLLNLLNPHTAGMSKGKKPK